MHVSRQGIPNMRLVCPNPPVPNGFFSSPIHSFNFLVRAVAHTVSQPFPFPLLDFTPTQRPFVTSHTCMHVSSSAATAIDIILFRVGL